jgi:hypothetical protein
VRDERIGQARKIDCAQSAVETDHPDIGQGDAVAGLRVVPQPARDREMGLPLAFSPRAALGQNVAARPKERPGSQKA